MIDIDNAVIVTRTYSDMNALSDMAYNMLSWLFSRYESFFKSIFSDDEILIPYANYLNLPDGYWDLTLQARVADDYVVIHYAYRDPKTVVNDWTRRDVHKVIAIVPDILVATEMMLSID